MPIRQANVDNKQQVITCTSSAPSCCMHAKQHIASAQHKRLSRRTCCQHRGHVPLQIYRSFEIGKLIKLIMLDTRIIGRNLQNFTERLVSRGGVTAGHGSTRTAVRSSTSTTSTFAQLPCRSRQSNTLSGTWQLSIV
jgi:hypothetical protein